MEWKFGGKRSFLLIFFFCAFRIDQSNGQLCQEDNQPCQNGGICFQSQTAPTAFFCSCQGTGFFGIVCENSLEGCPEDQPPVQCLVNPCDSATCPGNLDATCQANFCGGCNAEFYDSNGNQVDCSCPLGSQEFNCVVNPCEDLSCPSDPSATCVPSSCGGCSAQFYNLLGERVNCGGGTCPPEFEVECVFDPCVMTSCPAHPEARCQVNNCAFCASVYYDENNQIVDCDLDFTCVENGIIYVSGDTFTRSCRHCVCLMGNVICSDDLIEGCDVDGNQEPTTPIVGPCDVNPCQNGGTCIPGSGGMFGCMCPSNYIGQFCEREDPCWSAPCQNGGTCTISGGSFRCECPQQYMGLTCTVANLCVPSPCFNGGTCNPNENGIPECTCPEDFTGILCENFRETTGPCDPNPCLNGGGCIVEDGVSRCICDTAYTGSMCESLFNACAGSPVCQNGGTCVPISGIALCLCPPGYNGTFCEEATDPCISNPCENDGICINFPNIGLYCACLIGYTGSRCEDTRSVCDNLPCRNDGTCEEVMVDDMRSFSCQCPQGYVGATCEQVDDNPCSPANDPCVNGFCLVASSTTSLCVCTQGYGGTNCDTLLNACLSVNCLNGGECVLVGNMTAVCECTDDYIGSSCETPVSVCQVNPCFNQGECIPDATSPRGYVCSCPDRFEGDRCESTVTIPCFPDPCQNGVCLVSNADTTESFCLCDSGFTGIFCDQPFNPCASNPCQNSGSCLTSNGQFFCNCTEGFMGERCEERVRCQPNPCFNGGTCQPQGADSFSCECPRGYEGGRCEVMTDPCMDNTCVNGECVPFQLAYSCNCYEGYTGLTCEDQVACDLSCPADINLQTTPGTSFYQVSWEQPEMVCGYRVESTRNSGGFFIPGTTSIQRSYFDQSGGLVSQCMFSVTIQNDVPVSPCDPSPCENDAPCIPLQGDIYVCLCSTGYTGRNCENPVSPNNCDSNPCENDGFCLEASGTTMGYMCRCLPGFIGARCEILDDACAASPCQNGATCLPFSGDFYICLCDAGYTGLNCDVQLPCFSNPCQNNGVCQEDGNGGYGCACLNGYTGINCQQEDGCYPYPCSNGATCFDLNGDYFCSCPVGFSGRRCEMNDNECILECPADIVRTVAPSTSLERVTWDYEPFVCDLPVMFTFLPGSFFEVGDTAIQAIVRDSDGMTVRECTFTVSIRRVDPCTSSPCANDGTCVPDGSEFLCLCAVGYMGLTCEEPTTPEMRLLCDQEPCQNGATCVGNELFYVCFCAEGYSGINCTVQETQGPCDNNPCVNGGTCVDLLTTTIESYVCLCEDGFSGLNCEEQQLMDITPPRLEFCPTGGEHRAPMRQAGAVVFWDEPRAIDDSGSTSVTFQSHTSGSFFPFGVTVVHYDIEDPSGNSVSCFFVVSVSMEMTPPTCIPECPADINVVTDDIRNFTRVYWNLMSRTCNYTVLASHQSGSIFYTGSQQVTLMFRDGGEDVYSCDFTISVTQGFRRFCSLNPCLNLGTCQDLTVGYQCICPINFEGERCEILTGVDEVNPVVSFCPQDILVQTEGGASSAQVTWRTPQAVDNSGTVVVSNATNFPGDVFELGVTTVVYEFCDPSGNKAMCQFRVIVENPQECNIRCPDTIEKYAETGVQFIEVVWEQPAVMCNSMFASAPPPGSLFPVGNTLVRSMLMDNAGAVTDECQFMVSISRADLGNPCDDPATCGSGECILDSSELDGFRCECTRCFTGEYCERELPLANPCFPAAESLCQNGATCSFSDCDFTCICPDGYTGTYCDFELFQFDTTPPTIIGCPLDITRMIGAHEESALVTWDPIRVTDESGTAFLVQSTHNSGDEFPLGITTVRVIYGDASGNFEYCTFSITVQQVGVTCDTNACPEDILQFNTGGLEYMKVFWQQTDIVCGLNVQSFPQTGDLFAIGITPVTWTMTDSDGTIQAACTFIVEVTDDFTDPCFQSPCDPGYQCMVDPIRPEGYQCVCPSQTETCQDFNPIISGDDTLPPVVRGCNVRNITIELGKENIMYSWELPRASDNSGVVTSNATHEPPHVFEVGLTVVSYFFWDSSNNVAQCNVTINVTEVDTTPPTVFDCPEQPIQRTSDGTQTYLQVNGTEPSATDLSPPVNTAYPTLRFGSLFPVHQTHNITYTFTDAVGNKATCNITITIS